jgi:class 3 adenylate cyclase
MNSRVHLARLLDRILAAPERRAAIEGEIADAFEQEKAVMVLDMSGFSATTLRHGIVSFLLMIHQMQQLARPCLQQFGGQFIKGEADDLFCLFDSVDAAVHASLAILRALDAANLQLPPERHLYVSIGIGYGRILNIANEDLFGSEVNLASKLGEDLGRLRDILLTPAARARLTDPQVTCREEHVSLSGLDLTYYAVSERPAAGDGERWS